MASRTTLVSTETASGLPPETLLNILSYLDAQALGRIARVAKALLTASVDNALWKSLYERYLWRIPTAWIDREPPKWKDYYLTVAKVRKCAPENLADETATSNFWCMGLPDESVNFNANQKTLELQKACVRVAKGAIPILVANPDDKVDNPESSWEEDETPPLWSFKFPKELETNQPAASAPTVAENSETHKIYILVLRVLYSLRQGDRTQAVKLYSGHRKELYEYSRLLGWWLSEILYPDKTPNNEKITFPFEHKLKRTRQNFLQGFFLIWLKNGEPSLHFNTLRALRKIAYDTKKHYPNESPSGIFLEELISWTLCRNNSWLVLEKLATLYLHFPHHFPREEELQKAISLHDRIIRSFPSDRIPLHLATHYSLGWLQLRDNAPSTTPNERECLLPISIFQQALHRRAKIKHKDLKYLADFTSRFRVERAYPFVRACLNWIKLPYHEKNLSDPAALLYAKIEFFREIGSFAEAFDAWVTLCLFLNEEKKAKLEGLASLTHSLYSLLNAYKQLCEEVILLPSQLPHIKLAVAYAHYRLNRIDESLRIMTEIAQYFDPIDLEWLKTLGQADLRAAVIYSLCLDTPKDLEKFYLKEMLNYHPTQKFFIYHNLATRIYFIENQDDAILALKYAKEAAPLEPDQPETHILIGLCRIYNGDSDEGRSAIKIGETMNPEKFALKKQYIQNDLLIFPIEEK